MISSRTTLLRRPQGRLLLRCKSATTTQAERPVKFHLRLWNAYTRSLEKRPLLTKATAASAIFFCSDSVTQYVSSTPDLFRWDASRALAGASFGIVATSWLHYWWGFLEWLLARRLPVSTHRLANAATKVVLDQALGAPVYIYSYYVLTNFFQQVTLERYREVWKETNARASEMLLPTMLQHWRLWVPVHSFNFYFVPLHHRVLVQNTILMFWSGYLSHLNNQKAQLMSPDNEISATIMRRESERQMQAHEVATKATK